MATKDMLAQLLQTCEATVRDLKDLETKINKEKEHMARLDINLACALYSRGPRCRKRAEFFIICAEIEQGDLSEFKTLIDKIDGYEGLREDRIVGAFEEDLLCMDVFSIGDYVQDGEFELCQRGFAVWYGFEWRALQKSQNCKLDEKPGVNRLTVIHSITIVGGHAKFDHVYEFICCSLFWSSHDFRGVYRRS